MNKGGNNQFKRAFRDAKESTLTDARNTKSLPFAEDPQATTITTDALGKRYIKLLPNPRNAETAAKELARDVRPQYRLLDTEPDVPHHPTTTVAPGDGLIDSDLNGDVTEFLRILNDVGSRISYYIDPNNANDFASTRDIVTNDQNLDSISSNIIRGVEDLKAFFYEFGKRIAPPGVNPYCNNDCMQLLKRPDQRGDRDRGDDREAVQVNVDDKKGVDYAKGPYNPGDLNTYMNCLETLSRRSTMREVTTTYDDFNLKVFQSIITKTKTTKFIDSEIDELNVTRPLPYYNPIHLMIEILKIDTKLFNILYLLNLHNSCRSPITGVYYGKTRTKINEHGYPVLSNEVTSTDIHNATIQTLDFVSCILRLITFIDLDAYNKIIEDYFSISSVGVVQPSLNTPIMIDDTAAFNNHLSGVSQENIPTFLYGQLLSFCDAARQAINEIILSTFPNSPLYNPSKVANIAYNCTYGLLAVAQLIEGLLKSRCFAIIMSMLFPSGVFHSDHHVDTRALGEWDERFRFPRENEEDMQSITRLAIDGVPLDMSKVVPPKSIPHYMPKDPICINKAIFCTLITSLCGISRFLWNSNAPCLRLCDFEDHHHHHHHEPPCPPSPRPTTTMPPTSRDLRDLRGFIGDDDQNDNEFDSVREMIDDIDRKHISTKTNGLALDTRISHTNRAVRTNRNANVGADTRDTVNSHNARYLTENVTAPQDVDYAPDQEELSSLKALIEYLQKNTYTSVLTENGKVFTFLQVYISAFASHDRLTFNDRVSKSRSITQPSAINRSLHSMLTRGINF